MTATQEKDILHYMQKHRRGISAREAEEMFGCHRRGARIYDLRRAGHSIEKTMCKEINRYGHFVSFARYYLED